MKKRVNIVAVLFWLAGVVFLVGDVPVAMGIHHLGQLAAATQGIDVATHMMLLNIWSETRSAFLYGGQLIGIGVLIELVDQIRWNALRDTGR